MKWTGPLAALALAFLPSIASGQVPGPELDDLKARLPPGTRVIVTDDQGRVLRGRLLDLTVSSLTLVSGGSPRSVALPAVRLIEKRQGDPLWDGTLKGFAFGAGLCIAFLLENPGVNRHPIGQWLMGTTMVVSVASGFVADAVMEQKIVVYRAKLGTSPSRITVAPLLTPGRQGLTLAVTF